MPHGSPDLLAGGPPSDAMIGHPHEVAGAGIRTPSLLLERLERRTVLATFGLISASKGLELAVEALPSIIAAHPDACYLIAGQTHPEVVTDGERYRVGLERLVGDLGFD